jgi:O-antigen ligase
VRDHIPITLSRKSPARVLEMAFERPDFAVLCFYFFTLSWTNMITFPGLGSLLQITGIALVLVASYVVIRRSFNVYLTEFHILYAGFLFWCAITLVWSKNIEWSALHIVTSVKILVLLLAVWQITRSKSDYWVLAQAYVFGGWVTVVNSVITLQNSTQLSLPYGKVAQLAMQGRITSAGYDPNFLSLILAASLPIAIYLAAHLSRGILKWINWLYIPAVWYAILLTGSRGGLIVSIFASMSVLFVIDWRKFYAWINPIAFGFAAVVIVVNAIPPKTQERLGGLADELAYGGWSSRLLIWDTSWNVFWENVIGGVGIGMFRWESLLFINRQLDTHNLLLTVLVETGVIGFVFFLILIFSMLRTILCSKDDDRFIWLWVFATIGIGSLSITMLTYPPVWSLLALVLGGVAFSSSSKNNKNVERRV